MGRFSNTGSKIERRAFLGGRRGVAEGSEGSEIEVACGSSGLEESGRDAK